MGTVDKEQPTADRRAKGGEGPRWLVWTVAVATVLGALFAGGALIRDIGNWTWTGADDETSPSGPASASGSTPAPQTSAASGPPPSPASGSGGVHVDSLRMQAGAGNLVALPRPLKGQPALSRAIAVGCPENTAHDKQREVTYELRRRYQDLTLTVQAYSPDDPPAPVRVSVQVAVRRTDGTIDRLARGSVDARQGTPGQLTADVAGADDLTLRVECQSPTSIAVLADARITPV